MRAVLWAFGAITLLGAGMVAVLCIVGCLVTSLVTIHRPVAPSTQL